MEFLIDKKICQYILFAMVTTLPLINFLALLFIATSTPLGSDENLQRRGLCTQPGEGTAPIPVFIAYYCIPILFFFLIILLAIILFNAGLTPVLNMNIKFLLFIFFRRKYRRL